MKILFVGHLSPLARTYQRFLAFKDLGYDVKGISSVPQKNSYYYKGTLFDRIAWKLGYPFDRTDANKKILSEVGNFKPDILWIEKGNTIHPNTLRKIKEKAKSIKILSYSEDDMYASHNRSNFYTNCLKYYDVIFTTKSYNCDSIELPSLGAKNVIFVGKAFDRNIHKPLKLTESEKSTYGSDVGFIGSYEKERAESILFLAENGINVRVWGDEKWNKLKGQSENLTIEGRPLYGQDYVKGIQSTKINLGFLRKLNRDLQTARSVEIPACNAFMLAERTAEHLQMFLDDREASFFNSNQELLDKVRFYLENEEKRIECAFNGYKRCISSGYSHHDRLEYMLEKALGV